MRKVLPNFHKFFTTKVNKLDIPQKDFRALPDAGEKASPTTLCDHCFVKLTSNDEKKFDVELVGRVHRWQ